MKTFVLCLWGGVILLTCFVHSASAQVDLRHPNSVVWTACQLGMETACNVLIVDALGGNPEAQFRLGMVLAMDARTQDEWTSATILFIRAAKQGHSGAALMLRDAQSNTGKPGAEPRQKSRARPTSERKSYIVSTG